MYISHGGIAGLANIFANGNNHQRESLLIPESAWTESLILISSTLLLVHSHDSIGNSGVRSHACRDCPIDFLQRKDLLGGNSESKDGWAWLDMKAGGRKGENAEFAHDRSPMRPF